jgi:MFS transporter, DHA3 family, tetracycline resistance protein
LFFNRRLSNRFSAYTVYLIFVASTTFCFTLYASLSALYRLQTAGLDPLQLVLIGTVLELAVFLFEIPTGIVADIYSRRLSIIIGMVLVGLGFMLEGALPIFASMLLAQVIWGIGATFESGAVDAWITDELGEAKAGEAFLRASQVSQVVSLVAIPIAVLLGHRSLGLPMILGGAGYLLLGIFLILFMPEKNFQKHEASHDPVKAFRQTFGAGISVARGKPLIFSIFAITAILGASSETFDRLSEAHFLQSIGFPAMFSVITWFGIMQVGISLISIAVTERIRRRVKTDSHVATARALLTINVLLTLCVVLFGLAGNFVVGFAFYSSANILRGLSSPLFRAWLNQSLESKTRATVFSMNNQMDAIGQLAGGPVLGLLAKTVSIRAAFVVAGLLLLPASFLYLRTLRRNEPIQSEQGD